MYDGRVVEALFEYEITVEEYDRPTTLVWKKLSVCDDDSAPDYYNLTSISYAFLRLRIAISHICTLVFDAKKLPKCAFTRKVGSLGPYYTFDVKLAMKFGSVLEFEVMWNDNVVGSVASNYF